MTKMLVKLGDIATYINGYAFKPNDWSKEGLPIIRIQDLTGNSYEQNRYNGKYPEKIELKNGDILISWSASIGVYIWNGGKALLNQHIFKVVFDKMLIDKNYFVYAVEYRLKDLVSKTHGSTMKHIVKQDFDNTLIPYPELSQQHRIVAILDQVNDLISLRNQQLEQLDLLIKSRFVEMFGDPCGTVKFNLIKIMDLITNKYDLVDGPFGSQVNTKIDYIDDGEIPVIRTINVKMMSFSTSDLKFMSRNKYNTVIRSQVIPGDIILTKVGTIGNVCVFPEIYKEAVLSTTGSCRIRVDEKTINRLFLAYNLAFLKNKLINIASTSVQPFLNMNHIKNIEIIKAPLALQNQFAAFVEEVEKEKATVKQSLEELGVLKNKLMQEYFG